MSWSSRRRLAYVSIALFGVLVALAIAAFIVFYEPPTCFDGKQNGTENGIDCGGDCELICSLNAADIEVLLSRTVPLVDGVYSMAAVLENPNARAIARDVEYIIKMRDSAGLLVAEETGVIDIPAQREVPFFVHRIDTGLREPTRTDISIVSEPVWQRVSSAALEPEVRINSIQNNRVIAQLGNPYFEPMQDLTAVAFVSNDEGNVIAASETVITYLGPEEVTDIVFTWPEPFTSSNVSAEVLVRTSL